MEQAWFVYIVRCADNTLYTGVTTDIGQRLAAHNGDTTGGARYTRGRRPVTLLYVEQVASRGEAGQRETAIKKLKRGDKLALCAPSRAQNPA